MVEMAVVEEAVQGLAPAAVEVTEAVAVAVPPVFLGFQGTGYQVLQGAMVAPVAMAVMQAWAAGVMVLPAMAVQAVAAVLAGMAVMVRKSRRSMAVTGR